MSNNPGYAKGDNDAQNRHVPQPTLRERRQFRQDVATGKQEPIGPAQTWNPLTRQWDKEPR